MQSCRLMNRTYLCSCTASINPVNSPMWIGLVGHLALGSSALHPQSLPTSPTVENVPHSISSHSLHSIHLPTVTCTQEGKSDYIVLSTKVPHPLPLLQSGACVLIAKVHWDSDGLQWDVICMVTSRVEWGKGRWKWVSLCSNSRACSYVWHHIIFAVLSSISNLKKYGHAHPTSSI